MYLPPNDVPSRTIKIPVRVVEGRLETIYGAPLPRMRGGSVGDLALLACSIEQPLLLRWLTAEHEATLVQECERLWIVVREGGIPTHLREVTSRPDGLKLRDSATCVEVMLDEPLRLLLRGGREPILLDGRCYAAELPTLVGESLNHLYALVSQVFEPDRRSHTGNVFRLAYWNDGARWWLLDDLRGHQETVLEHYLALAFLWTAVDPHLGDEDRQINLFPALPLEDLGSVLTGLSDGDRKSAHALVDNCLKEAARRPDGAVTNVEAIIAALDYFTGSTPHRAEPPVEAVLSLLIESQSYLLGPVQLASPYQTAIAGFAAMILRAVLGYRARLGATASRGS